MKGDYLINVYIKRENEILIWWKKIESPLYPLLLEVEAGEYDLFFPSFFAHYTLIETSLTLDSVVEHGTEVLATADSNPVKDLCWSQGVVLKAQCVGFREICL